MAHTLVGVERLFFLLEILFFLGSSIFLVVEFVFLNNNNNNNIPKNKITRQNSPTMFFLPSPKFQCADNPIYAKLSLQ